MSRKEMISEALNDKGLQACSLSDEVEKMFQTAESRGFKGEYAEQYVAQLLHYLNEKLALGVI